MFSSFRFSWMLRWLFFSICRTSHSSFNRSSRRTLRLWSRWRPWSLWDVCFLQVGAEFTRGRNLADVGSETSESESERHRGVKKATATGGRRRRIRKRRRSRRKNWIFEEAKLRENTMTGVGDDIRETRRKLHRTTKQCFFSCLSNNPRKNFLISINRLKKWKGKRNLEIESKKKKELITWTSLVLRTGNERPMVGGVQWKIPRFKISECWNLAHRGLPKIPLQWK